MIGWNPISRIPDFRKWEERVGCSGQGTWENTPGTRGTLVLTSLAYGAVGGVVLQSQGRGLSASSGKVQTGHE